MPNVNDLIPSKFLKKVDLGPRLAALLTIKSGELETLQSPGGAADKRFCLTFYETPKKLVLNATNLRAIANVTGEQDTDKWPGKKIVAVWDPNISMAGRITGGVRIRAPKPGAVAATLPEPDPEPPVVDEDDPGLSEDIPF